MDIVGISTVMANKQVRQEASIRIASKVMDNAEEQSRNLLRMMEQSVSPSVGKSVDLKV